MSLTLSRLDKIVATLILPFWASYWILSVGWCHFRRGHTWETDWREDLTVDGVDLKQQDPCKHCPAERGRGPLGEQ